MQIKKIRPMTYDELSTILQIIGGGVLTLSFAIGIAIIWAGIMASKEKDAKVRTQDEALARLNLEVETAKERAAKAEIKASEIEQQNLKLRIDLEDANRKRLKLEDHIEPRHLRSTPISKERLQKYEGTLYILEYCPDRKADADRIAQQIDGVLHEAGWNRIAMFGNPYNSFRSGVQIATRGLQNTQENFFKPRAASELSSYLMANKLDAMEMRVNVPGYWTLAEQHLGADKISYGVVKIFVGLKSDRYFSEKFTEERQASMKKEAESEGKPVVDPPWLAESDRWFSKLNEERLEQLRKEWGIFP
jgi:hypothetical protein